MRWVEKEQDWDLAGFDVRELFFSPSFKLFENLLLFE